MTQTSAPVEYFKNEAKKLLQKLDARHGEAIARVERVLNDMSDIGLMRAQHVIAVEHGFSKWEELIKQPVHKLQESIDIRRADRQRLRQLPSRTGTPLGNFYRGPGVLPISPQNAALADMFDSMTLEEQRRYLNEDARALGFFDQR